MPGGQRVSYYELLYLYMLPPSAAHVRFRGRF